MMCVGPTGDQIFGNGECGMMRGRYGISTLESAWVLVLGCCTLGSRMGIGYMTLVDDGGVTGRRGGVMIVVVTFAFVGSIVTWSCCNDRVTRCFCGAFKGVGCVMFVCVCVEVESGHELFSSGDFITIQ